jgi:hypothetical protein
VTRFPPEPSGYLHVGHAKAALLNDFFAKHYAGRLIVRFDDTNPAKESTEFRDSIIADLKTLGVAWDGAISYTSDYFPQLLDLGEALTRAGHLYADDTPVDRMREERMAGTESARRGRSVDENLAVWAEMKAGSEVGRANCMRFRMDMASTNKAMCDPVAYRCNVDVPHWRTGTTYKVSGGEGMKKKRERRGWTRRGDGGQQHTPSRSKGAAARGARPMQTNGRASYHLRALFALFLRRGRTEHHTGRGTGEGGERETLSLSRPSIHAWTRHARNASHFTTKTQNKHTNTKTKQKTISRSTPPTTVLAPLWMRTRV